MIPTREDLEKIAIELYTLNRGGNDTTGNSVEGIRADHLRLAALAAEIEKVIR